MNFLNFKWINYLKLKDNKLLVSFLVLLLISSSLIGIMIPKYISWLYESYSNDNFFKALKYGVLLFFSQYLVKTFFSITMGKYVKDLITSLREDLFKNWIYSQDKIMTKEEVYLSQDKYTRGEFQARLITDIQAIRDLVTLGSLGIILDFVFIVSCMFSFFALEKFYGVTLIVTQGLACVILIWLSRFIGVYFQSVAKSAGELSRVLSSVSKGFKQLFFARKGSFSSKLSEPYFDNFLRKQLFANIWDASYYSLAESLFPIFLAFIVFLFPYSEVTSIAIFASLIDLIQRSIVPIKGIAGKISNFQKAMASITRVNELESDLSHHSFYEEKARLDTDSSVQKLDVSIDKFSYRGDDQREIFSLKNIKFSLSKGEKLGIIGKSGSGKSSVLRLLSGEIFSDEIDIKFTYQDNSSIRRFDSSSLKGLNFLRSQVSLISQDSYVFTDTLEYNITFSRGDKGFSKFWELMQSNIPYMKFWGIKPGDALNPQEISMGQKQLISALRYCYKPSPIVLFDEVSSGLDGQLEKALSDFLDYIQGDVMMILVAHRVETFINCKEILFLEGGNQTALGSHETLYQNHESYQDFFTILGSV